MYAETRERLHKQLTPKFDEEHRSSIIKAVAHIKHQGGRKRAEDATERSETKTAQDKGNKETSKHEAQCKSAFRKMERRGGWGYHSMDELNKRGKENQGQR